MAIATLHKTPRRKRGSAKKNPVVDVLAPGKEPDGWQYEHRLVDDGGRGRRYAVTYQLELVKCGKAKCRKWHGPYWYAYWSVGERTRTLYVGKVLRPAQQVLNERKAKAHATRSQSDPSQRQS